MITVEILPSLEVEIKMGMELHGAEALDIVQSKAQIYMISHITCPLALSIPMW